MPEAKGELSEETKAIVKRLTREGELLRNDGAHSIKSIKVELTKFEGIFGTLQKTIDSQVEVLRQVTTGDAAVSGALESQIEMFEAEAATEKERRELARRQFENQQLSTNNDRASLLAAQKKQDANQQGFFSRIKSVFSKKNFKSLFENIKLGAGIGIAAVLGYQFFKGFAESMGVDVEKLEKAFGDGIDNFVKFLKDVDWKKLTKLLTDPLALTGLAALAALPSILNFGANTAITIAGLRALMGGGTPPIVAPTGPGGTVPIPDELNDDNDPDGKKRKAAGRKAMMGRFLNWRTALIGAIGTGLIAYSDEIGNMFKDDAQSISKDELMNTPITETAGNSNLSTVAGFATLGSFFGIKGALVGALLGGAYVIGKSLVSAVDDAVNDTGALPNAVEAAIKEEQIRQGEGLKGVNPRGRASRKRRAEEAETVEEAAARVTAQLNEEIAESEAAAIELQRKLDAGELTNRNAINAPGRLKRLKEEVELRKAQLLQVNNLITKRMQENPELVDYDPNAPGTQTLEQFELNQETRAREAYEKSLIPDGPGEFSTQDAVNEKTQELMNRLEQGTNQSGVTMVDNSSVVNEGAKNFFNRYENVYNSASAVSMGGDGLMLPGNAFCPISR
jgi:hypothetical protein